VADDLGLVGNSRSEPDCVFFGVKELDDVNPGSSTIPGEALPDIGAKGGLFVPLVECCPGPDAKVKAIANSPSGSNIKDQNPRTQRTLDRLGIDGLNINALMLTSGICTTSGWGF